mmetsp:Transcript_14923/g.47569  ORF Transcript_14923/g.47569 Transcript_14923/m.47569 type:complete len:247 (-) Transcript_14923:466-1206(-)
MPTILVAHARSLGALLFLFEGRHARVLRGPQQLAHQLRLHRLRKVIIARPCRASTPTIAQTAVLLLITLVVQVGCRRRGARPAVHEGRGAHKGTGPNTGHTLAIDDHISFAALDHDHHVTLVLSTWTNKHVAWFRIGPLSGIDQPLELTRLDPKSVEEGIIQVQFVRLELDRLLFLQDAVNHERVDGDEQGAPDNGQQERLGLQRVVQNAACAAPQRKGAQIKHVRHEVGAQTDHVAQVADVRGQL